MLDSARDRSDHAREFPAVRLPLPTGWRQERVGEWVVCVPPGSPIPEQGWKIHVAGCLDNAEDMIAVVREYCVPREVSFKFLAGRTAVLMRNAKYSPRHSSGKVITIYPRDEDDCVQIMDAATAACAAGFLLRLPHGLRTALEEVPMSGGEAQRLGLARAFAHADTARLLILDDATSSLDTVTEMLVSRALTGRLRGTTRLIVAHRLTTAARADLVAWLDGGTVRALAPHDTLWAHPGYRALFSGRPDPGQIRRDGNRWNGSRWNRAG